MDRHSVLIEELPLAFRTVDDAGTHLREDAFAFREMPYGFNLYIACIVPLAPLIDKLLLGDALEFVVAQRRRKKGERWACSPFFYRTPFKNNGLTVREPRLAIVVRYVVSNLIGIQGLDISVGRVKLAYTLTPEEYMLAGYIRSDSERIKKMLDELLIPDEVDRKRMEVYTERGTVHKDIRWGAIALFNYACKATALQEKVPFIGASKGEHRDYLELFPSRAIFSRPLRDPLGFINLTNLSSILQGHLPFFSSEDLLKALPGSFLMRS